MKQLNLKSLINAITAISFLAISPAQALTDSDCSNIPKLENASKAGDLESRAELGICYSLGKGVDPSLNKAWEILLPLAESGIALAMWKVGDFYLEGNVVDKDFSKAMSWFLKANEKGLLKAKNSIGMMYLEGKGVKESSETAIKWFEEAKDQNDPIAYFVLGNLYQSEGIVHKDTKKALSYLLKAAELGLEKRVAYSISKLYLDGKNTLNDHEKSFKWAKLNAESGHPSALTHLATYYEKAIGTPRSIAKAVELYKQAAAKGDRASKYELMTYYFVGSGDFKRNLKEARKWATVLANDPENHGYQEPAKKILQKIAAEEQGEETLDTKNAKRLKSLSPKQASLKLSIEADCSNINQSKSKADQGDMKSLIDLGVCYTNGNGVPQSYETGYDFVMKAAHAGSPMGNYLVGVYYNYGSFVRKDDVEAAKWYLKAANAGLANAQHMMGVFYTAGSGVPRNQVSAMKWFKKAIDQKYTPSLMYLGRILDSPFTTNTKALEASFSYYVKALEYGDMKAAYPLSEIFKIGKGVPRDEKQAFDLAELYLTTESAFAYRNLSDFYFKGIGTKQNIQKAVSLLKYAGSLNDEESMFRLMNMYYTGQNVAKDIIEAQKWANLLTIKGTSAKKDKATELLRKIAMGE